MVEFIKQSLQELVFNFNFRRIDKNMSFEPDYFQARPLVEASDLSLSLVVELARERVPSTCYQSLKPSELFCFLHF